MKHASLFLLCIPFIITVFIGNLTLFAYGQSQTITDPSVKKSEERTGVVSSNASVTIQVSNESLKTKEGMIRSSVLGFLNSGPNILETPETDEPHVKSKITNQINKDIQNVEGTEATNAIVGVEVSKALKSLVTLSDKPNQTAIVTVQTSSTCKPYDTNLITCDNTVVIK